MEIKNNMPEFEKWWAENIKIGAVGYTDSSFYECQAAFEQCKKLTLEILKYPYPDLDIEKHIKDRIKEIEEL